MLVLNKLLLPGIGLKHIIMNSFSNIYLQLWIKPVPQDNLANAESTVKKQHWSAKWSMIIVELVLQIENLVILIILLAGFQSFEVAKRVARSDKFIESKMSHLIRISTTLVW